STSRTFSAVGSLSPHLDAFIPANTLLHADQDDSQIPNLEDTTEHQSTSIFNTTYDDDLDIFDSSVQSVGVEVFAWNQTDKNASPQDTNGNEGTQDNVDARKEVFDQHYIVLTLWSSISSTFKSSDDKAIDDKPTDDIGSKTIEELVNKEDQAYRDELDRLISQEKEASDAADALRQALVSKTHNKTPYELLNGRTPRLDFIRPFGYHVTILNTLDPLGKFDGKADEGFLVGYSITSKAFRMEIEVFAQYEFQFEVHGKLLDVFQFEVVQFEVQIYLLMRYRVWVGVQGVLLNLHPQFWNTATSKTVNSVKQIHAIVNGKAVVISKSSVRSDLLFNDEDGIACLTNA
nr:ribonuclease H-like domain-containing protein [Tanacetum cinerariifolium]